MTLPKNLPLSLEAYRAAAWYCKHVPADSLNVRTPCRECATVAQIELNKIAKRRGK